MLCGNYSSEYEQNTPQPVPAASPYQFCLQKEKRSCPGSLGSNISHGFPASPSPTALPAPAPTELEAIGRTASGSKGPNAKPSPLLCLQGRRSTAQRLPRAWAQKAILLVIQEAIKHTEASIVFSGLGQCILLVCSIYVCSTDDHQKQGSGHLLVWVFVQNGN